MTTNNGAGGLVAKWRAEADAIRGSGMWDSADMADRMVRMCDELEAALQAPGETPPPSDALRRVVEVLEATAKCLSGLQSQFDHAGCTCTFPDDNCCSYSRADTVLTKARAALAAHKALAEGVDRG